MNLTKITGVYLRLCSRKHVICLPATCNNLHGVHRRHFALQSSIESIAKTQSGIFQSISESAPVEYTQGFLLNVHDLTGLPWWATIVCTTVIMRTAITVPLAIYQQYILAKVENLNLEMPDIVKELRRETAIAIKMYSWDEKTAKMHYKRSLKNQWNNLIVRDNCHPVKASLLIWFQIPMWISFSVSLRNLVYQLPLQDLQSKLTLTEMTVGGFGWIPNLTEVDSSYILPVVLGLLNLTIIEVQNLSKVRVSSKFQTNLTHFFRGFSILMIPIAASVPSCLALYWTTSSAYGLVQNVVLMSPRIKRFCHIPVTPSQLDKPYSHLWEGIKHKFSVVNK